MLRICLIYFRSVRFALVAPLTARFDEHASPTARLMNIQVQFEWLVLHNEQTKTNNDHQIQHSNTKPKCISTCTKDTICLSVPPTAFVEFSFPQWGARARSRAASPHMWDGLVLMSVLFGAGVFKNISQCYTRSHRPLHVACWRTLAEA